MPYKEREIKKLYYSMREVSEMFEVNPSLIRHYDSEFDILKPKKNKKGNRLFRPEDIENLKIIFYLVKERGYTIDGAKRFMKNHKHEVHENKRIIASLENLKEFLLEIRDSL